MDMALESGSRGAPSRLGSALRGTARAAFATYKLGGRTLVAAPLIAAIVVLPELAQHAAEIHLGMFESKAGAQAAANHPLRWAFGYAKIAGLVVAMLATARYWALGSVRRALLIAPGNLLRLGLAIGLTLLAELPFTWLKEASASAGVDAAITFASVLVQAGLLVYLIGALLDDRTITLRSAFGDRWPTAILITALAALAFAPSQALHGANHLWAMEQPTAIVWALMLFDSLLVGLLATLVGAALFVAYRAGPTWRGWTTRPETIA